MTTHRFRRAVEATLLAVTLVLAGVGPVAAARATQTPTRTGTCWVENRSTGAAGHDLRAAIASARPGDVLEVRGVCAGGFTIDKDLTLIGPATLNGTTCSDGDCFGEIVLWVDQAKVKLKRMTITGGSSTFDGGGIQNFGDLTLSLSVVRDNIAEDNAGGISNDGRLVLNASVVRDNSLLSTDYGGGILNRGTVVMNRTSIVTGNTASFGAGIFNQGTVVMNSASSVTGNTAEEQGGGILNDGGHVWFSRHWHGTLCGNTPDDWPAADRWPGDGRRSSRATPSCTARTMLL